MATIDSDAHVIESERTWEYVSGAERDLVPRLRREPGPDGTEVEYWDIDGVRRNRGNIGSDTTKALREMDDIEGRLRHMDELGVDIQVLYPSIYTQPITRRPEVDLAMARSYNRWLGDIWSQAKERLRWVAVTPVLDLEPAESELRFAKNHGACGVLMQSIPGDRLVSDPYFFPLYEIASDLDMPVCVHASLGNFGMHELFRGEAGFYLFKLPVVGAFHNILFTGVPERFPELRFGFIEVSAQWVPYALHDLARRLQKQGKRVDQNLMQTHRIYVACQTDDDLAYVVSYSGEDNILIGSDYGHKDTSAELDALRRLKEQGEVAPHVIDKILDDNARAFYAI
jgi:predicted TIM-barrel fold metal-dependent hydrolase